MWVCLKLLILFSAAKACSCLRIAVLSKVFSFWCSSETKHCSKMKTASLLLMTVTASSADSWSSVIIFTVRYKLTNFWISQHLNTLIIHVTCQPFINFLIILLHIQPAEILPWIEIYRRTLFVWHRTMPQLYDYLIMLC